MVQPHTPAAVQVDLAAGAHKQSAFLRLNPAGQIPVLGGCRAGQDDGQRFDRQGCVCRVSRALCPGTVFTKPHAQRPALSCRARAATVDRDAKAPSNGFPDGSFVLPESGAILFYLADAKAGPNGAALLPADPAARAECLSWAFYQAVGGSSPSPAGK